MVNSDEELSSRHGGILSDDLSIQESTLFSLGAQASGGGQLTCADLSKFRTHPSLAQVFLQLPETSYEREMPLDLCTGQIQKMCGAPAKTKLSRHGAEIPVLYDADSKKHNQMPGKAKVPLNPNVCPPGYFVRRQREVEVVLVDATNVFAPVMYGKSTCDPFTHPSDKDDIVVYPATPTLFLHECQRVGNQGPEAARGTDIITIAVYTKLRSSMSAYQKSGNMDSLRVCFGVFVGSVGSVMKDKVMEGSPDLLEKYSSVDEFVGLMKEGRGLSEPSRVARDTSFEKAGCPLIYLNPNIDDTNDRWTKLQIPDSLPITNINPGMDIGNSLPDSVKRVLETEYSMYRGFDMICEPPIHMSSFLNPRYHEFVADQECVEISSGFMSSNYMKGTTVFVSKGSAVDNYEFFTTKCFIIFDSLMEDYWKTDKLPTKMSQFYLRSYLNNAELFKNASCPETFSPWVTSASASCVVADLAKRNPKKQKEFPGMSSMERLKPMFEVDLSSDGYKGFCHHDYFAVFPHIGPSAANDGLQVKPVMAASSSQFPNVALCQTVFFCGAEIGVNKIAKPVKPSSTGSGFCKDVYGNLKPWQEEACGGADKLLYFEASYVKCVGGATKYLSVHFLESSVGYLLSGDLDNARKKSKDMESTLIHMGVASLFQEMKPGEDITEFQANAIGIPLGELTRLREVYDMVILKQALKVEESASVDDIATSALRIPLLSPVETKKFIDISFEFAIVQQKSNREMKSFESEKLELYQNKIEELNKRRIDVEAGDLKLLEKRVSLLAKKTKSVQSEIRKTRVEVNRNGVIVTPTMNRLIRALKTYATNQIIAATVGFALGLAGAILAGSPSAAMVELQEGFEKAYLALQFVKRLGDTNQVLAQAGDSLRNAAQSNADVIYKMIPEKKRSNWRSSNFFLIEHKARVIYAEPERVIRPVSLAGVGDALFDSYIGEKRDSYEENDITAPESMAGLKLGNMVKATTFDEKTDFALKNLDLAQFDAIRSKLELENRLIQEIDSSAVKEAIVDYLVPALTFVGYSKQLAVQCNMLADLINESKVLTQEAKNLENQKKGLTVVANQLTAKQAKEKNNPNYFFEVAKANFHLWKQLHGTRRMIFELCNGLQWLFPAEWEHSVKNSCQETYNLVSPSKAYQDIEDAKNNNGVSNFEGADGKLSKLRDKINDFFNSFTPNQNNVIETPLPLSLDLPMKYMLSQSQYGEPCDPSINFVEGSRGRIDPTFKIKLDRCLPGLKCLPESVWTRPTYNSLYSYVCRVPGEKPADPPLCPHDVNGACLLKSLSLNPVKRCDNPKVALFSFDEIVRKQSTGFFVSYHVDKENGSGREEHKCAFHFDSLPENVDTILTGEAQSSWSPTEADLKDPSYVPDCMLDAYIDCGPAFFSELVKDSIQYFSENIERKDLLCDTQSSDSVPKPSSSDPVLERVSCMVVYSKYSTSTPSPGKPPAIPLTSAAEQCKDQISLIEKNTSKDVILLPLLKQTVKYKSSSPSVELERFQTCGLCHIPFGKVGSSTTVICPASSYKSLLVFLAQAHKVYTQEALFTTLKHKTPSGSPFEACEHYVQDSDFSKDGVWTAKIVAECSKKEMHTYRCFVPNGESYQHMIDYIRMYSKGFRLCPKEVYELLSIERLYPKLPVSSPQSLSKNSDESGLLMAKGTCYTTDDFEDDPLCGEDVKVENEEGTTSDPAGECLGTLIKVDLDIEDVRDIFAMPLVERPCEWISTLLNGDYARAVNVRAVLNGLKSIDSNPVYVNVHPGGSGRLSWINDNNSGSELDLKTLAMDWSSSEKTGKKVTNSRISKTWKYQNIMLFKGSRFYPMSFNTQDAWAKRNKCNPQLLTYESCMKRGCPKYDPRVGCIRVGDTHLKNGQDVKAVEVYDRLIPLFTNYDICISPNADMSEVFQMDLYFTLLKPNVNTFHKPGGKDEGVSACEEAVEKFKIKNGLHLYDRLKVSEEDRTKYRELRLNKFRGKDQTAKIEGLIDEINGHLDTIQQVFEMYRVSNVANPTNFDKVSPDQTKAVLTASKSSAQEASKRLKTIEDNISSLQTNIDLLKQQKKALESEQERNANRRRRGERNDPLETDVGTLEELRMARIRTGRVLRALEPYEEFFGFMRNTISGRLHRRITQEEQEAEEIFDETKSNVLTKMAELSGEAEILEDFVDEHVVNLKDKIAQVFESVGRLYDKEQARWKAGQMALLLRDSLINAKKSHVDFKKLALA